MQLRLVALQLDLITNDDRHVTVDRPHNEENEVKYVKEVGARFLKDILLLQQSLLQPADQGA